MPLIGYRDNCLYCEMHVAGVTHKNGRRSRQTILRRIYWEDEPYDSFSAERDVGPKLTEFEGQPAVEIWVRGGEEPEMVGYVPKTELPFVLSHWDRYAGVSCFEVSGGGTDADGERINFGARLVMRFLATDEEKKEYDEKHKEDLEKAKRQEIVDREREARAARARAAIQDRAEAEKRAEAARKQAEAEEKEKQKKDKFIAAGIIVAVIVLLKLLIK